MKRAALVLVALAFACDKSPSDSVAPDTAPAATDASSEPVAAVPDGYKTITPVVVVPDIAAAIDWYARAFGAETTVKLQAPDGTVIHAEIQIGDARLMVVAEDPHSKSLSPKNLGGTNAAFYLYSEDTDAIFAQAVEAGAEVAMPPMDMMWGDRLAGVIDPAGHQWELATHVEDITPEEMDRRGKELGAAMEAGKPLPEVKLNKNAKAWKPEGYTSVTTSIVIDGGAAGLEFYEKALGANITETMLMPDGKGLMHGEIQVGTSMLMLHSAVEEEDPRSKSVAKLGGSSVRMYLYVEGADERLKTAVAGGGTEIAPVEEVFWGDRLGVFADPSGMHWGLATRVKTVAPDEIARQLAAMPARGGDGDAPASSE